MAETDPGQYDITMLYVEDDPDSRKTLSEIIRLRYPDMQLLVADNGDSGLEMFKQHLPGIVITDINMPILNGIGMAAQIKSMNPTTEIIALTAFSHTQYLLQAIEIGIDSYILKPVEVDHFFTVIDKALGIIRSQQLAAQQNEMIRSLNAELARKAAELEATNRALASMNQELESFNYTVAHDLRSPMVNISGYSQLLLETHSSKLDDLGKMYLQTIHSEIVRMNSLTGSLLKFSLYSQKCPDKKWTNLSDIAREIRDKLLTSEPKRQVSFIMDEEVNGYCDPDLLRIVLDNLLGNAWKYSGKKDEARIEFGTISKDEDLVYFVRDNGAGFDNQESEKMFAPFQRIQRNDGFEGFGIGLATVNRIITRHGGRIWADGEPGKGATIYFTL